MDLNNHPKMRRATLAVKPTVIREADLTRTAVAEGHMVNCYETPVEGSPSSIIARMGADTPAVFTTKTYMGKGEKPNALDGTPEAILHHHDFAINLMQSLLETEYTLPFRKGTGAMEGIRLICSKERNRDETIGRNYCSESDIMSIVNTFNERDIVLEDDGWYRMRHYVYLPITNSDIALALNDFETFNAVDQATIRTAKALSLFKTYLTIILQDGTEFVLWYKEGSIGIVTGMTKRKRNV